MCAGTSPPTFFGPVYSRLFFDAGNLMAFFFLNTLLKNCSYYVKGALSRVYISQIFGLNCSEISGRQLNP